MYLVDIGRICRLWYRLRSGRERRRCATILRSHKNSDWIFTEMELVARRGSVAMMRRLFGPCLVHMAECLECWTEMHRRMGFWKQLEIKAVAPLEWLTSNDPELQKRFEAQAESIDACTTDLNARARAQWNFDRGEHTLVAGRAIAESRMYVNERRKLYPGFPKTLMREHSKVSVH